MKRFLNWIKKISQKYFVKHVVHWVQSTLIIPLTHEGKMVLHIERTGKDGIIDKRNYQIEHLLDENLQVTEQTLEMEKKWLKKTTKI
jgi:hypothetical protein